MTIACALSGSLVLGLDGARAEPPRPPARPTTGAAPSSTAGGQSPAASAICAYSALDIDVYGNPNLSHAAVVRPDGYISLPLIGDVRASDRTPESLEAELRSRYRRYLVEPVVTVAVRAGDGHCSGVRIIGAVKHPRAVPFANGMRVADVLVAAGGLAPTADGNGAVLVRNAPGAPTQVTLHLDDLVQGRGTQADVLVAPGDTIFVPEGFFAGNWQRTFSLTLAPAFTDNYRLAPSGDADPAFVTALTPEFDIAGSGARVSGALKAALTGQYVTLAKNDFEFIPNIVGAGTAEVARDRLYVDAATAIERIALNADTPTSAVATNTQDLTLVQSYLLSPYAVTRVKDVALAELRYTLAGTATDDNGNNSRGDEGTTLSDSITNGLGLQLASPDERSRVGWQAQASGQQTTRFGDGDVLSAGATISPRYALSPSLSLLGVGGYSRLSVGSEHLSGPEGAAGFRYQPSPHVSLSALGGWRLENPQAEVVLRSDLGPRTTLTAAYTDSVGVGQTTLINTLGDIAYDPQRRRFVSRQTGLAYLSSVPGYTLNDTLTRTRQGTVSLARQSGNSTYTLSAYVINQEPPDSVGNRNGGNGEINEFNWELAVGWEQVLTPTLRLRSSVGYLNSTDNSNDQQQSGSAGSFDEVRLQLGLTKMLTDTVSTFARYYFQQRFADTRDDRFSENAVMVGVTRKF